MTDLPELARRTELLLSEHLMYQLIMARDTYTKLFRADDRKACSHCLVQSRFKLPIAPTVSAMSANFALTEVLAGDRSHRRRYARCAASGPIPQLAHVHDGGSSEHRPLRPSSVCREESRAHRRPRNKHCGEGHAYGARRCARGRLSQGRSLARAADARSSSSLW
jgi:hypothetical protein